MEIFGMTLQLQVSKCTCNWGFFLSFEDAEKEIPVQRKSDLSCCEIALIQTTIGDWGPWL
jgi:hypothetical protein